MNDETSSGPDGRNELTIKMTSAVWLVEAARPQLDGILFWDVFGGCWLSSVTLLIAEIER